MGYSLRSWDYRFTLWLGFNPNTFQVGELFFTFLWGVASIKRVWCNTVLKTLPVTSD